MPVYYSTRIYIWPTSQQERNVAAQLIEALTRKPPLKADPDEIIAEGNHFTFCYNHCGNTMISLENELISDPSHRTGKMFWCEYTPIVNITKGSYGEREMIVITLSTMSSTPSPLYNIVERMFSKYLTYLFHSEMEPEFWNVAIRCPGFNDDTELFLPTPEGWSRWDESKSREENEKGYRRHLELFVAEATKSLEADEASRTYKLFDLRDIIDTLEHDVNHRWSTHRPTPLSDRTRAIIYDEYRQHLTTPLPVEK